MSLSGYAAIPPTFQVDVEGIGTFEFRKRTLRLEQRVSAEYSRITEVPNPEPWASVIARYEAEIKVLASKVPEGWTPDEWDPEDKESYEKIRRVGEALAEREKFFRTGAAAERQPAR